VRRTSSGGVFSGPAVLADDPLHPPPSSILTDSTASFPSIAQYSTLRLTHQKAAGTITKAAQTSLTDTNTIVPFDQLGLVAGDIVRADGAQARFAVVTGVESGTTVRVEEWLDDTTRQPTAPPASGAIYQLFHIFLGRITQNTLTVITVERWRDLDGATFSAATLNPKNTTQQPLTYEVLPDHPNYLLSAEANAQDVSVLNNVFRRGWSDQCSIWVTVR
jgi:hypothetical protein